MLDEKLNYWKEIAAHLECNESTARRWEKKGLPVYRPTGSNGSVYAYKAELNNRLKTKSNEASSAQPEAATQQVAPTVAPVAEAIRSRFVHRGAGYYFRYGIIIAVFIAVTLWVVLYWRLHRRPSIPSVSASVSPILPSSLSKSSPNPQVVAGNNEAIPDEIHEPLIAEAKSVVKQSQIWEMLTL